MRTQGVQQDARLVELGWKQVLQIHDELVFESPSNELSLLIDLVTQEMTGVSHIDVPLKVDVKSGDNWAECEAVT